MIEKREGEKIDGAFCHPVRMRIMLALCKNPTYVSELSRKQGIDRVLLAYHLKILEGRGYLSSVHEISNGGSTKGRAIRKFEVTKKAKEEIEGLGKILRNIS